MKNHSIEIPQLVNPIAADAVISPVPVNCAPQLDKDIEPVLSVNSELSRRKQSGYRVLITYTSASGSTRGVAEDIGRTLSQAGAKVDVKPVQSVQQLDGFDAVIIGSPIRYDKWMPAAVEFVSRHQARLSQLPVAYFFTCLTLYKRTEQTERQALAYADKLYSLLPQIKPVSVGQFAGVLNFSKLPFFFGLLARSLCFVLRFEQGDYRDWDAIRNWSKDVYARLNSASFVSATR